MKELYDIHSKKIFEDEEILIHMLDGGMVYYKRFNKSSGKVISVSGNNVIGFIKSEGNLKDSSIERKRYYPNGALKSRSISNGEKFAFRSNKDIVIEKSNIVYNSGIYIEYDERGNILNQVDFDKEVKFKLADVLKLFEKKGIQSSKLNIEGTLYQWRVYYQMNVSGAFSSMVIDTKTGKIISEQRPANSIE